MAVVKGNAYGHGAVPVTQAALAAGATWCGVARVEEALELRKAGFDCPILLLGFSAPGRYDELVANHISLTVWDPEQMHLAKQAAARQGRRAQLHIKVNTGMNRLGVSPEETPWLASLIDEQEELQLEGIFTHFARADEIEAESSDLQEKRFKGILETLQDQKRLPPVVHAANSAAALTRPGAYFTLVRAGIAMYGLQPSSQRALPQAFQPALAWKAVLSQVKLVPSGSGISYGHVYCTKKIERIGTVPVGYVDGFRRILGSQVLVGGKCVPFVGRVCMDQLMVQLDTVPEARMGDEVVMIGRQNEACQTAEELGRMWGTINYEVTACIAARVPRIYP